MTKIININQWLEIILKKLEKTFRDRLVFVGLQGSYNRGEATSDSDIDLIVILDNVNFNDLKMYKKIIDEMPDKDKACGFISGKDELKKWTKSDLFQFFYDTKPLLGNLAEIIKAPSIEDIQKSIKVSCENIYHLATHSFLHSNNISEDLKNLYKMAFFVLQAKYFLKTNEYIPTKKQLEKFLTNTDKEILNICINKKEIDDKNSEEKEELYNKIIKWSCTNI